MSDYKFKMGQRVVFYDQENKITRSGIIVARWWYDCQGFQGFPMYDIDYGEPKGAFGVDESAISKTATVSPVSLGQYGRTKLNIELVKREALLDSVRKRLLELRREIRTIKKLLTESGE